MASFLRHLKLKKLSFQIGRNLQTIVKMSFQHVRIFLLAFGLCSMAVKAVQSSPVVGCHSLYEETCPIGTFVPRFDGLFPDEKFLNESCGPMIRLMRCTIEFNKTCPFGRAEVEPVRDLSELIGLVEEICDEESSLRYRYMEHVDCLTGLDDEIKKIMYDASEEDGNLYNKLNKHYSTTGLNDKQWRALQCISNKHAVATLLTAIYEDCDIEATLLANELFRRVLTPNQEMCPNDDADIQAYIAVLEQSI